MRYRNNRAGNEGRIKKTSLSISFVMHCALILILLGAPFRRPPITTYEVFAVQFIEMPRMEMPSQPPVREEPPAPVRAPEPPKQPPAVRREAPPSRPAPQPAPEPPPVFSAERFRDTLSARIETPTPAETTQETAAARTPVEISSIDSELADINISEINLTIPQWYILLIQNRIKENWQTHNILGRRTTTVSFRIHRNGTIENIALERSSGNSSFDNSVIDAVRRTTQLPPFPREIPDANLDIVIDFTTEG